MLTLDSPIQDVYLVGPRQAAKLARLDIYTVRDLLFHFPRLHVDRRQITMLAEAQLQEEQSFRGTIDTITNIKSFRRRRALTKATFTDKTGSIEVVWYNQPYLSTTLKPGDEVVLSGKIKLYRGTPILQSPQFEKYKPDLVHSARLVPVYPETEGISSKWLRSKVKAVLYLAEQLKEHLPEITIKRQDLIPLKRAAKEIHFPSDETLLQRAKERLAFDELFFMQLAAIIQKNEWKNISPAKHKIIELNKSVIQELASRLPFALTADQERSILEICTDMASGVPMLRLLEGDVGSGKTLVAASAALLAYKSGYQVAFMAPTEVLAQQHYKKLAALFAHWHIPIRLLVGSLPADQKLHVQAEISSSQPLIAIGTHALIQDKINFANLGLAIIDEQHRFGVAQRNALKAKGHPHVLMLTATPIPRTMAMAAYGDLDLSIIKELPPGRKPITTRIVPPGKRELADKFIKAHLKAGRQVFVICPLIEESEHLQVKSAKEEARRLEKVFSPWQVGLLHGRLKPATKERIMASFSAGELPILVSTAVIEVGIDVPNATIMVIEGAERFGLAQLHQFRGRVGRSQHTSFCLLYTESDKTAVYQRLNALVSCTDGFKLAEIDLAQRGPGELIGTCQSGFPDFKMASFGDQVLVYRARTEAQLLLADDPNLSAHQSLKLHLQRQLQTKKM